MLLGPGPRLSLGWHVQAPIIGSPIVGGNTVYSIDAGGALYALDANTGSVRASLSISATSRFATPTLSGNQVFVGTLHGIVAVTLS